MKRITPDFLALCALCVLPLGCAGGRFLNSDLTFSFQKGADFYTVACVQAAMGVKYTIAQLNTSPVITKDVADPKVASCGDLKKALMAKRNPLADATHRAKVTLGAPDSVVYLLDQANLDVETLDLTAASANAVDLPGGENTQYPTDMEITPDGSALWVTQLAIGQNNAGITPMPPLVSIFNTAQQAFTGSFTLPNGVSPNTLQFSPDGTSAYITNDASSGQGGAIANSSVLVLNVATQTVTKTIPTPKGAGDAALSPDGLILYTIGNNNGIGANNLTVIDTTTNTVATSVALPDGAVKLFVNPTGTQLYVLWFRGIDVFDTATLEQVASIPAQNSMLQNYAYFSPDGATAFLCGCGYGVTYQVDVRTNTVIKTIQGQAHGFVFGVP